MSTEHDQPNDDNGPAAAAAAAAATAIATVSEPETQPPQSAALSSSDSDSDGSDSDSTPKPTTEWLATTRKKRATAGNRMKSMLAQEEPDSDLELLFAEDEDDQGFSDADGDASDVQMDSSSDDEDDNNAAVDDLEGEKELERQAKERRSAQRKRKAQDAIPAKFRKKVRIDPTTTRRRGAATATGASTPTSTTTNTTTAAAAAPAPRPKKKSERTSWLPATADMPTRASSRQTTRHSKEQLHAQMEEREARRLKQLEQMQKKQARLEALKKPPMTQEERLREAELVESRNSKSLNRWEEAEKQREEERRAKLAALNERTLKGPVITFWSGTRQWKDGGAAKYVVMEEKPKRIQKKPKDKENKDKGKEKSKIDDKDDKAETIGGEGKEAKVDTATSEPTKGSETLPEDAPPKATTEAHFVLKEEEPSQSQQATGQSVEEVLESQTQTQPREDKTDSGEKTPAGITMSNSDVPGSLDITMSNPEESDKLEMASDEARPAPDPTTGDVQPENLPSKPEAQPLMAMPSMQPPPATTAPPAPAQDQQMTEVVASPPAATGTKPSSVLAAPVLAPPPFVDREHPISPSSKLHDPPKSNVLAPPNTAPDAQAPATVSKEGESELSAAPDGHSLPAVSTAGGGDQPAADAATVAHTNEAPPPPNVETPPSVDTTATRNTIIYQNFDENAIRDKTVQTQILFGRKMNKLAKPSPAPTCVITNHPARYRDPTTDLPFHNLYAYREIQRLLKGEYNWSKILGAWAGSGSHAAKGVPARFLNPDAAPVVKEGGGGGGENKDKVVDKVKEEEAGKDDKEKNGTKEGGEVTKGPGNEAPGDDEKPVDEKVQGQGESKNHGPEVAAQPQPSGIKGPQEADKATVTA